MYTRILLMATMLASGLQSRSQTLENTTWMVHDQFSDPLALVWFNADTMYVDEDGFFPLATYELNGNTVSFTDLDPGSCNGTTGTYGYLIGTDSLHFTLIDDACVERTETFVEFHWVAFTTGIAPMAADRGLAVFPNPTTGELQIERTGAGPLEIRIYSTMGALMHEERTSSITTRIDLGAMPNGIYMIEIRSGEGTTLERIVKE